MAGTPTEHAGWVGSLGQPCRVWSARLPEISTSFQQLLILGQLCPCTGWPPPGSRKGLGQSSSAGPKVIAAEDTNSPPRQSSACCPHLFRGRRVGLADVMPSGVHGPCTLSVSHSQAGSWKTGAPDARLPLPPPGLGSHCDRVAFGPAACGQALGSEEPVGELC